MSTRRISAVALAVAASLVVAACGSSSSSSSSSGGAAAVDLQLQQRLERWRQAARSTAPARRSRPRSTASGAQNLSSQGLTVNYNPLGSGAGVAGLQAGTIDFAGSDPAEKPERSQGG